MKSFCKASFLICRDQIVEEVIYLNITYAIIFGNFVTKYTFTFDF